MSQECRASGQCGNCSGKHHFSICGEPPANITKVPVTQDQQLSCHQRDMSHQPRLTTTNVVMSTTSALNYIMSVKAPVLLQTARAMVFKVSEERWKPESCLTVVAEDPIYIYIYITKETVNALSLAPR